jgi:hypothetical protein
VDPRYWIARELSLGLSEVPKIRQKIAPEADRYKSAKSPT